MVEGFDIALEMSGSPVAVEDLLANMNHGGRVALLGLPKDRYAIDWGRVITHMITLRGIYGREMFETWYLMGSMLATSPSCGRRCRRSSPAGTPRRSGSRRSPRPGRAGAARSCSTGADGRRWDAGCGVRAGGAPVGGRDPGGGSELPGRHDRAGGVSSAHPGGR